MPCADRLSKPLTWYLLAILACSGLISACAMPKIPGVYRIDVQQGNVVTQEMLDKLRIGMVKRKVRFVLGTPLITDPFNQERWDYLYSFQERGGERTQHRLSVYFEDEKLARIEGELQPFREEVPLGVRKDTVVVVPAREQKNAFFKALIPDFLEHGKVKRIEKKTGEEEKKVSFLEAITPDFLKFGTDEAEPKSDTQAGEPDTASDQSEQDQGSADEPTQSASTAKQRSDEDLYLRELFKGFGRPAGTPEDVASLPDSENTAPALDVETDASTPDAEVDQSGFFQRLIERLKHDENDKELDAQVVAPDPAEPSEEANQTGFFQRLIEQLKSDDSDDASEAQSALPDPEEARGQ